MKIKKRLALLLFLVFSSVFVFSQKTFLLNEQSGLHKEELLTPYLYCLDSVIKNDILFSDTALRINSSHSFSFRIKNTTDTSISRIIYFGERYLYVKNVSISSSLIETKKINGIVNNLELIIEEGETKIIYFSVQELNNKDPNKVSVLLLSNNAYQKKEINDSNFQSFFLGLIAFLCFFNFILYFITKWTVYFKYALYIFTALLYFSFFYGVLSSIFPSTHLISSNHIHIWYNLMFITYFYFISDFGEYRTHVPKAYFLLYIGIGYKLIQTFFNSIFHLSGSEFIYSTGYISVMTVIEITLMTGVIYYSLKNKNTVGRVVIAASLIMTIGATLDQLVLFNITPPFYYMEAAIIIELLAFSIGLGVVTRQFYKEKLIIQELHIQQLEENEKIKIEFSNRLEKKISERTRELEIEKREVEKKNEENELLLGEIHHRVKNNLQVISSMLSLQERNISDPTAKAALSEGKERIKSMALIHKMLYQGNSFLGVNMREFTHKLTTGLLATFGLCTTKFKIDINSSAIKLDIDTAIPLGLVLDELIINALKYACINNKNPTLKLSLEEVNQTLLLTVWDNGNGKTEQLENSNSFGMKLVKSLSRQIGGTIFFDDTNGLKITIAIKDYKIVP